MNSLLFNVCSFASICPVPLRARTQKILQIHIINKPFAPDRPAAKESRLTAEISKQKSVESRRTPFCVSYSDVLSLPGPFDFAIVPLILPRRSLAQLKSRDSTASPAAMTRSPGPRMNSRIVPRSTRSEPITPAMIFRMFPAARTRPGADAATPAECHSPTRRRLAKDRGSRELHPGASICPKIRERNSLFHHGRYGDGRPDTPRICSTNKFPTRCTTS